MINCRIRYIFGFPILFVLLITILTQCINKSTIENNKYKLISDIFYKIRGTLSEYEEERCYLDLYLPTDDGNFPVIVWFHAGDLERSDKNEDNTEKVAKYLATKNIGIATVNYRLYPKARFPEYIDDVVSSFNWVKDNISQYGGDTASIFLAGHSAGGYLVLMAGSGAFGINQNEVNGIINLSGQTLTHSTVRKEQNTFNYKETPIINKAAPAYYVSGEMPPVLSICGEDDSFSRKIENIYYVELLKKLGNFNVRYMELEDKDHWSLVTELCSEEDKVYKLISDFIIQNRKSK